MERIGWMMALVLACASLVRAEDAPAIPATPAGIVELVEARPFTVDEPFVHHWRAEKRSYTAGYMLVLHVDPALVFPRQVEEPVLYVGSQTARRLNVGVDSGRVVAIVPVEDLETFKLDEQRIWFGTPAFPENIDDAWVEAEVEKADASIEPVGEVSLRAARTKGGDRLRVSNLHAVMPVAGRLVETYAPTETDTVKSLKGVTVDRSTID